MNNMAKSYSFNKNNSKSNLLDANDIKNDVGDINRPASWREMNKPTEFSKNKDVGPDLVL